MCDAMPNPETVRSIVLEALDAVNQQRPVASRFVPEGGTLLYGAGGVLDSLELVNLVIELEQRLDEQLGAVVTLADERAVSQQRSPFRSVPSLVDFVVSRLTEHAGTARDR
jgi:acyl carrier protein